MSVFANLITRKNQTTNLKQSLNLNCKAFILFLRIRSSLFTRQNNLLWRRAICLFVVVGAISASNISYAQSESRQREGRIKSATLYYLAKFIDWPQSNTAPADLPVRICIVGESELIPFVKETLEGKPVGKRVIETKVLSFDESIETVTGCSLIYLGDLQEGQAEDVVKVVLDKPIVTVSSNRYGAQYPTVIYLYKERNNVRIEVNLLLAKKLNLEISSELLAVSRVVR